uniref:Reverse transcriptase domain-containing protein n=1 Tax=Tanacetum cinerariifolium TaxID=118510 RepID=A0A6L2KJN7_TANCI|nr:reverse transcriptase domain-containing protein [Tanacetum cinerariifolium]
MLKLHEQTLPKSNVPAPNAIRARKFVPKPKIPPPPKRENPAKDSICHECGEIGHWKRNCPQCLAELMKKKKTTASGAGGSERMVGENHPSWSDKLDDALWTFRTAFKTPIGCTPYKLVYGKSCHLPIELEHRAYWALKHVNFDLKTAGDHRKL